MHITQMWQCLHLVTSSNFWDCQLLDPLLSSWEHWIERKMSWGSKLHQQRCPHHLQNAFRDG